MTILKNYLLDRREEIALPLGIVVWAVIAAATSMIGCQATPPDNYASQAKIEARLSQLEHDRDLLAEASIKNSHSIEKNSESILILARK